eukprot:s1616_g22.t1
MGPRTLGSSPGRSARRLRCGAAADVTGIVRLRRSIEGLKPTWCQDELEELHQLCWKRLHSGHEATAPWREVFALCCFMRSELQAGECSQDKKRAALRLLDLGLILGGPDTQIAFALHQRAEGLAEETCRRANVRTTRALGKMESALRLALRLHRGLQRQCLKWQAP